MIHVVYRNMIGSLLLANKIKSTKKSNSDLLGFPHKRKNSVIPHTDSEVIRHTFSLHSVRLSPILRQWSVFVCLHLMLGDGAEIGHVPSLFRIM